MENLENKNRSVKPNKNGMKLYKTLVFLLSGMIRFLFLADIKGRENIPKNGACFVCANHISNWDPVLVAVAVKRPIHFMAKKEIFKIPFVKSLVSALGAFPVDREHADFTSIKTALTHLKNADVVGIFPQGKRCRGVPPETEGIKGGTGMLVYKTMAQVLPVCVYTKNYKIRLFKKVYIHIGKPITYEMLDVGPKSPEEYQRISDTIFNEICLLSNNAKDIAEHGRK